MGKLAEVKARIADRRAEQIGFENDLLFSESIGALASSTPLPRLESARAISRSMKVPKASVLAKAPPPPQLATRVAPAPTGWFAKLKSLIVPAPAEEEKEEASAGPPPLPPAPEFEEGSLVEEEEEDAEDDGADPDGFWALLERALIEESLRDPRSRYGAYEVAAVFDARGGEPEPLDDQDLDVIFGDEKCSIDRWRERRRSLTRRI